MSRKWKPEVVENIVSSDFDDEVYEQVLVEMGEIIYIEICQLQKISFS